MTRGFCRISLIVLIPMLILGVRGLPALADITQPEKPLDVPYEPTPPQVVDVMLKLAGLAKDSYLFDLGCGDGRILIAAAKQYGARGFGVDIDGQRIREATDLAKVNGVDKLITFKQQDIMDTDLSEATAVTVYLLNTVNLMIRPHLFADLRPGVPVVSHAFHMADWEPDKITHHPKARGNIIYMWIIPARAGGTWKWTTKAGAAEVPASLRIDQEFQAIRGMLTSGTGPAVAVTAAELKGKDITFAATVPMGGADVKIAYKGTVDGDTITGTQEWVGGAQAGKYPWAAKRDPVDISGAWQVSVPTHTDLAGTLRIERKGDKYTAVYARKDKAEQKIAALYVWGASVRWEIPTEGNPYVFTGSVDGGNFAGTLMSEGWSSDQKWSAKRAAAKAAMNPAAGPAAEKPAAAAKARQWNPALGDPKPGDEYTHPKDGSVMVWIPGGEFTMGSDTGGEDEKPAHKVKVDGFWMGRYEVANAQYAKFMAAESARPPMFWEEDNYKDPKQPVVGVTWLEAKSYVDWAGLRMPTEAEWEYAAAAGKQFKYATSTGEIGPELANARNGKQQFPMPVGSYPANPFGLYDMAGNAWDFTSTRFAPYPYNPNDGRESSERGGLRVMRGGCWAYPFDYSRTTQRHRFASHLRLDYSGIRVAATKIEANTAKTEPAEKK